MSTDTGTDEVERGPEPPAQPARGRHAARHRAGGRGRLRGGVLAVAAVVLVLLVVGVVVALLRPGSPDPGATPPAGSRPGGPPSAATSAPTAGSSTPATGGGAAAPAGAELARWAGTQLPPGDRLVAAPGAGDALRRSGVPDGVVTPAGTAPAGTALTVTDGAVPAGARLVARFGSPAVLAVVDPSPVAPTADELRRRQDLAAALLANPTTHVAAPAAAVLRSAAVDPRLLSVLATLTARSGIGIAALPAAADEPADVPLARSALVDEVGGQPVTAGSPDVAPLVAFLQAQLAPYAPDQVTVTSGGVLVGYRYLSGPDAAVTSASY